MDKLTIITPTYNRQEELIELFASLQKQTNQNFQWLVIDDGSTDETGEWFERLPDTQFAKEYHYKQNGGKHTALNASHPYITGKYMTIVDSDDTLTADAVDVILQEWAKYAESQNIGMITFKKSGKQNAQMNKKFPTPNAAMTLVDATNQGMKGDHCETARTELFIAYDFPVYPGERFLGEALMWLEISRGKQVVFVDKVVYICEYLKDGLTKSGRAMRIRNPKGGMAHAKIFLEPCFSVKLRLKNALLYVCYGYFAGMRCSAAAKCSGQAGLVYLMGLPGWGLYRYWKNIWDSTK